MHRADTARDLGDEPLATEGLVERLMGRKPELRFRFIQENAEFAADDLDL